MDQHHHLHQHHHPHQVCHPLRGGVPSTGFGSGRGPNASLTDTPTGPGGVLSPGAVTRDAIVHRRQHVVGGEA